MLFHANGRIYIYNYKDGSKTFSFPYSGSISSISYQETLNFLLVVDNSHNVYLYNSLNKADVVLLKTINDPGFQVIGVQWLHLLNSHHAIMYTKNKALVFDF